MSSMDSLRLRDLILKVRKCRTAAEERGVISRQSAIIREGLKNASCGDRYRYMLMLLYIHMLGYHTEFAQLEVVNLIAQSDYGGKRIGYLALQTLINENDEVLTLIVNHMKNDLNTSNSYVICVALNAAANIANEDMSRDIFDDVIKFFDQANNMDTNFCRACLTAVRIVRKAPDYAEYFLQKIVNPFVYKDVDVLTCVLILLNTCLKTEQGQLFLPEFRKLAGSAANVLKQFLQRNLLSPFDVSGINAPYTQIQILEFIQLIGNGSFAVSELVNDVLTQTMTNNDATYNAGAAVHYACVRTIDSIESDEGLRTLAINTISQFLSTTRDNNLRFVALQMLAKFATNNLNAVQEHQSIILSCLKDADISIRRRALTLTVRLINAENVRLLIPDLITYLRLCAEEMREEVTRHICNVIEAQSPTEEWRVEVSLQLLRVARQAAPVNFATKLIAVLSQQPAEVQTRAIYMLWDEASLPFDALHDSRKALLLTAVWAIGEFHSYLIDSKRASVEKVVTCLNDVVINTSHKIIKQYGLTALMKVGSRHTEMRALVLRVLNSSTTAADTELQQRACEYVAMLNDFPEEAASSFAQMPAIPVHPSGGNTLELVMNTIDVDKSTADSINSIRENSTEGTVTLTPKKTTTITTTPATAAAGSKVHDLFGEEHKNVNGQNISNINSNVLDDLFSGIAS